MYKIFLFSLVFLFVSGCASTGGNIKDNEFNNEISNSSKSDAHYKMGINSLQAGSLANAFQSLFKALKYNDKDFKIYAAIAYAYDKRGDIDKADEFYKKSIALNAHSSVYNNYANFLIEQKRYKESIEFSKVAANDPTYEKSYMAYINMGDAYMKLNKQKQALLAYKRAIRIFPAVKDFIKERLKSKS